MNLFYYVFFVSRTELYSYTEEPEFSLNRDYFEEDFKNHGNVASVILQLKD